jgi:exosortase
MKPTIKLPSTPVEWARYAFAAVVLGLIYYAFWRQSTGELAAWPWLYAHWQGTSHYSHGPLIPWIALGLVWWKRQQLWAATVRPVSWGAGLIGLAMLIYYVGVKAANPRLVVVSFILLLYALVLTLAGREVFRVLFFPISFLFLMIPLNFLEERIGLPLRLMVAQASTGVLNTLGIETLRVGTAIHSSVFRFDVADPCSGIRSLMALTTVTAAYAYVTQSAQWKRWVLFLSAIPLAVLGNMARVTSIALVAQVYGQELATKAYHDWSGYIVFGVSLSAMVLIGQLLNLPYRHYWNRWMRPVPAAAVAHE